MTARTTVTAAATCIAGPAHTTAAAGTAVAGGRPGVAAGTAVTSLTAVTHRSGH